MHSGCRLAVFYWMGPGRLVLVISPVSVMQNSRLDLVLEGVCNRARSRQRVCTFKPVFGKPLLRIV